eukprot:Sspe_Gene.98557::Locus_71959_Transcript_1_1_Confidence_1.000_Length_1180::g.98557::m.98557
MNAGVVTKAVAGTILVTSVLSPFAQSLISLLALIPVNTITVHFYIWNLLTVGLIDTSIFLGLPAAGVVLWAGSYLEPLWGSDELARYLAIVTVASSVSTFILCMISYSSGTLGTIYMYYCGALGTATALLVALKQLRPDEEVVPGVPVRCKALPLAVVVVVFLIDVVLPSHVPTEAEIGDGKAILRGSNSYFTFMGFYFGWVYLRFFQSLSSSPNGDVSEPFSFHHFFPEPVQPVVKYLGSLTFRVVAALGFGKAIIEEETASARRKLEQDDIIFAGASPYSSAVGNSQGGMTDADRRRQIAMAALQERMKAVKVTSDDAADFDAAFDIEAGTQEPQASL